MNIIILFCSFIMKTVLLYQAEGKSWVWKYEYGKKPYSIHGEFIFAVPG